MSRDRPAWICPACDGPRGLRDDCKACQQAVKIAILRARLSRHWQELKQGLKELFHGR